MYHVFNSFYQVERFGHKAVSKMYAEKDEESRRRNQLRKLNRRSTPVKMKSKPSGISFEEKDARAILRPYSLHKYIQEPSYKSVVYICRRNGIVPLFSLCSKDSKTVLSSNVKLLQGRNVQLGRPQVFVRDNDGRMLAVGGTRRTDGGDVSQVVTVPRLHAEERDECPPFVMDSEYAKHALQAINVPKKLVQEAAASSRRVDIRTLKKMEKSKVEERNRVKAMSGSELISHLFGKVTAQAEDEEMKENEEEPEIKHESEATASNVEHLLDDRENLQPHPTPRQSRGTNQPKARNLDFSARYWVHVIWLCSGVAYRLAFCRRDSRSQIRPWTGGTPRH